MGILSVLKSTGVGGMISRAFMEKLGDFVTNVLPKLWQAVVNWAKKSIKIAMKDGAFEGFKYFLKNAGKEAIEIIREYYLRGEQWYKRETEKAISADEVPEDIRRRAERKRNQEIDATDELKEKLELCA